MALKNSSWAKLAKILSSPSRLHSTINLDQIDIEAKAGDTIIIPGKILSLGNLTKKIKLCSLGISQKAREKISESKSEYTSISEEIKKNTKAEGVKIIA